MILLYAALIAATIVAGVASIGIPEALMEVYENEPLPVLFDNLYLVSAVVLPLCVAAVLGIWGLYMFKTWGPPLSLGSTIAGMALYPFLGASVYGGIETALSEASTILWGAILAASYWSPVAARFSTSRPI